MHKTIFRTVFLFKSISLLLEENYTLYTLRGSHRDIYSRYVYFLERQYFWINPYIRMKSFFRCVVRSDLK